MVVQAAYGELEGRMQALTAQLEEAQAAASQKGGSRTHFVPLQTLCRYLHCEVTAAAYITADRLQQPVHLEELGARLNAGIPPARCAQAVIGLLLSAWGIAPIHVQSQHFCITLCLMLQCWRVVAAVVGSLSQKALLC